MTSTATVTPVAALAARLVAEHEASQAIYLDAGKAALTPAQDAAADVATDGYWAALNALPGLRATTLRDLVAKARAARVALERGAALLPGQSFERDAEASDRLAMGVLDDLIDLIDVEAGAGPDAALVQACAEHAGALAATNRDGGKLDPEDCPLGQRYLAAFDAVNKAPTPRTLAGIVALSGAALAEARSVGAGREDWDAAAGAWAGDAVKAMMRLAGEGQA